jgi:hypothetical protein
VIVPSIIGVIVIVLLVVLLLDDDDGAADADLTDTTSSPIEEPSDDTDSPVTDTTGAPSTTSQPATTQTNAGAPSPGTAQSTLEEARIKFDGFLASAPGDPPTYNMDYRTGIGTHECLVVDGSDVQRVGFADDCETGEAASNCAQCAPLSVTSLFDTIQRFIDNDVPFTVSYDARDGYPTYIETLDFPPDDADRGFQITIGTVGPGTGD